MVFSNEAYERAFPRKSQEAAKVPEQPKSGNVLEEADKIEEAKQAPIEKSTPAPSEPPADDPKEPEGGADNGD